jgi:hypothetical protein
MGHQITQRIGDQQPPTLQKKEGIQVICATAWFFGYCIPLPLGQSTELKRPERQ